MYRKRPPPSAESLAALAEEAARQEASALAEARLAREQAAEKEVAVLGHTRT